MPKTYHDLNWPTRIAATLLASLVISFAYSYNNAKQRAAVTNADGTFWVYGYDALGQVTSGVKCYNNVVPVPGEQFGYTFDNIQVISLMQGKDAIDLGVAFYIGLISALIHRSIAPGLVVLGQMSIHGVLGRVEGLGAGAKRVVIPTEIRRDFAKLPAKANYKLQIDFCSDPSQAAFKALAET